MSDYKYLKEKIDNITIIPDDATASMVHEFGYVTCIAKKGNIRYDVKFLVIQPSDGDIRNDLWKVGLEEYEDYAVCMNLGIGTENEDTIIDKEVVDFILQCYDSKDHDTLEASKFSLTVTDINPSHTVESGYVIATIKKGRNEYDIRFDVLQNSDGDQYVAIDEDCLDILKKVGIEVETELTEFTGGYVYDCIVNDSFNFVLDWYDTITTDKR